jgi:tRNA A37 methylthiotransferase MiaB
MFMKFSILTLGCKVNKYESDALIFELRSMGHEANDELGFADAYIINTCAVTNESEKKSRQMIERARKFNPDAKVYVMGCAAQNRPEQFADRNVEFVVGTAGKKKLLENLQNKGQQLFDLPAMRLICNLPTLQRCSYLSLAESLRKFKPQQADVPLLRLYYSCA